MLDIDGDKDNDFYDDHAIDMYNVDNISEVMTMNHILTTETFFRLSSLVLISNMIMNTLMNRLMMNTLMNRLRMIMNMLETFFRLSSLVSIFSNFFTSS